MSYQSGRGSNKTGGSKAGGSSSGVKKPAGGSGTSPTASGNPTGGTSIPRYLSFIFRIQFLRPNYQQQSRRLTTTGAWVPPDISTAYTLERDTFWRWTAGRVTQVAGSDPVLRAGLRRHKVASLFSQDPDTPHLLVVPFDVRTRNVRDFGRGWLPITFDHIRRGNASGPREYYSAVTAIGDESNIAAPGQTFWMPQLLPHWYNYRAAPNSPQRTHLGLIGDLSILLALAVFSAPATHLGDAMSAIQPGAWSPHGHQYPAGHLPGERGVVVHVFLDPMNPEHSTIPLLDNLSEGDFGPFYGRTPGPPSSSQGSGSARVLPSGPSGYPATPYPTFPSGSPAGPSRQM